MGMASNPPERPETHTDEDYMRLIDTANRLEVQNGNLKAENARLRGALKTVCLEYERWDAKVSVVSRDGKDVPRCWREAFESCLDWVWEDILKRTDSRTGALAGRGNDVAEHAAD